MLRLLIKCLHILFPQQQPQTTLSSRNPKHGDLRHRSPVYPSHCLVLYSFPSFLWLSNPDLQAVEKPDSVIQVLFFCVPLQSHQDSPAADLSRCVCTLMTPMVVNLEACSKDTAFLSESRVCNDIKLRDGALKFRFFFFFLKKLLWNGEIFV